jgi:UDP-N-acetylmuramoyl-tripeptide--D-alanyl-D-alanine ligase
MAATPIPPNAARFTAAEIVAATHATHSKIQPSRPIVGVTTDSRACTPGCAFVALRGGQLDGHQFVPAAVKAGAHLIVVEKGRAPGAGVDADVVEVPDTLVAWGDVARAHIHHWRHQKRVVAITGSAGKTTTKELTHALLSTQGPCHVTLGNLNNRIGVPAVVLGLEDRHRFAVIEIGMSVPGEIAAMASIVEPDVAVIVNVGVAHAEGVGGTREAVGREKGALFEALKPEAIAVPNADDEVAMAQLERTLARRVEPFGKSAGARYRLLTRTSRGAQGSRVTIERPDGEPLELDFPIVGEAAALDLCAALAATEAALLGPFPARAAEEALASLRVPEGRASVRTLGDGTLLIDDSYNANPDSVRAALEALAEIAEAERRRPVVILGEMKELGPLAEEEHRALGASIARARVGLAVSCGGLMDLAVGAAGVPSAIAASTEEAAEIAVRDVRAGDVVLVKGSRSVGTERVAQALARRGGAS